MSDKLAIIEDGYTYRICWVVDGEEGAWLGDYLRHYLQHNSSMDGTNEHRIATEAANQAGGCEIDNLGLLWESKARAQEALVSARAALKAARCWLLGGRLPRGGRHEESQIVLSHWDGLQDLVHGGEPKENG